MFVSVSNSASVNKNWGSDCRRDGGTKSQQQMTITTMAQCAENSRQTTFGDNGTYQTNQWENVMYHIPTP